MYVSKQLQKWSACLNRYNSSIFTGNNGSTAASVY